MDTYKTPAGAYAPRTPPDLKAVRRILILCALAAVLVIGACTSTYTVAPEEEALVLRFGRYVETTGPGLHLKLPFGIDSALTVPVQQNRKLEFGFRTASSGVRTEYTKRNSEDHEIANMLTGDLNIADVEWVVQYRIKSARDWVFNVEQQESAIQDLSEAVMRAVVGDHTITEVVASRRDRIKALAKQQLQAAVDFYALGVRIETVELQNVTPPAPVRDSFNEVNAAQQERSRIENEAERDRNRVIPKARGQAEKVIEEAEGYAIDRVNRAKGDVARFVELYAAYRESPAVMRQRLYLETIERVLPKVQRIVVADGDGVLKLLPIDGAAGGR